MENTGTPEARRGRLEALKGPAVLLLILVAFFWKLSFTRQYDWIWGPDLSQQVLPWWEEQSRQVHQGQLPLWDAHSWGGQPFLGQAQPGTAYPVNWLLFAMPRVRGHISKAALQWYYILTHYLGALFCYLLCRDLGRSRTASVIGGFIFALSGYFYSTGWPQMANGAVWAPLVFLFLFRMLRGVRPLASAAFCGVALGLSWLSGHHQAPTFLTLCCCGVWLFYVLRSGRVDWRMARLAGLALAIVFLTGALQILPAVEYGQAAKRWVGAPEALEWNQRVPYFVHAEYSLRPAQLFWILFPGIGGHANPFVGVGAFAFAVLGVAAAWRQRAVRWLMAIGLAAILFSLGRYDVFHGLLYAVVPLLEKARTPAMVVFVFTCAVAALAAFGIDEIAAEPAGVWVRRLARALLVFGIGALTMMLAFELAKSMNNDRFGVPVLAAVLMSALLYGWRAGAISQRQLLVLTAGLMLLELGTESSYMLSDRNDAGRRAFLEKTVGDRDIAAFLSSRPRPFRVDSEGDDRPLNWGVYHDVDVVNAYGASVTKNVLQFEFASRATRRLLNVRYTIARKAPAEDFREVFQSASGAKVYEDPAAFPRAWTVHELVRIASPDQGRYWIRNDLEGLRRRKAFLYGAPPRLDSCAGEDRVGFVEYRAESVRLRAEMACRGMVVLSDTAYPGWTAEVDGQRAPVHEVNFAMRGVVVPQGSHEVRFVYRPLSVYLGAALTLAGVVAAFAVARVSRG